MITIYTFYNSTIDEYFPIKFLVRDYDLQDHVMLQELKNEVLSAPGWSYEDEISGEPDNCQFPYMEFCMDKTILTTMVPNDSISSDLSFVLKKLSL